MFSKLALISSLAVLAVATPTPGGEQSCSTGPIQCCNSVQPAGAPAAATALGLLGVIVQDVNVPIGLTCNPISVRDASKHDKRLGATHTKEHSLTRSLELEETLATPRPSAAKITASVSAHFIQRD